jgi:hypothetical protein
MFDAEKEVGDQLVGQYSLIPTPFSFWGKPYLAGKTENCMCHPAYRGRGIYFQHEKKYFLKAQKRFQLFFTTTGNVANGAPGAVRRKLGYTAFDYWNQYVYILDCDVLKKRIYSLLSPTSESNSKLLRITSNILSKVIYRYFKLFQKKTVRRVKIQSENDAPLDRIESLWKRNKKAYGITVDRSIEYLNWRINLNPFFEYQYLTYSYDGKLKGYIIFYEQTAGQICITDIMTENKEPGTFRILLHELICHAKKRKLHTIVCTTNNGNKTLKSALHKNGFVIYPNLIIKQNRFRSKQYPPFHIYMSKDVTCERNIYDPKNWYLTDLVFEGRR